jgi:hypothetical protein
MKNIRNMTSNKIWFRTIIGSILFCLATGFTAETNQYPIKNNSFKKGEKLTYRLHYGLLTGGYPTLLVGDKTYNFDGKACHRIEVTGKSTGAVHKLFQINDTWRSYVDTATMLPKYAFRNIVEGDYKLIEDTYLNRGKGKVQVDRDKKGKKTTDYFDAPEGIHDIVSGFFYFRNVDWSKKSNGDKVTIKSFFENELYTITVVYKGIYEVKTDFGKINCYKLQPEVPDNDLFKGDDAILFYLSADANRIPIKIKASMFVGSVEMDIYKYENLKSTIKFK